MTAPTTPQSQREFIITEQELKDITRCLNNTWNDIFQARVVWAVCRATSRPHPPAPDTHFSIGAGLRADVVETLRKAGCPCLAQQVLEETMPDFHVKYQKDIEEIKEQEARAATLAAYDKGIALIRNRIDCIMISYEGEHNEDMTRKPYAMADGMNECILMLKSLRTSAQEQPK
jgi:hypothetical protein